MSDQEKPSAWTPYNALPQVSRIRLAIWAYVLACIGPLFMPAYAAGQMFARYSPLTMWLSAIAVCSPLAILLGALAWLISPRHLMVRHHAVAAMIVGAFGILATLFTFPILDQGSRSSPGNRMSCLSNVKQLSLATLMYAQDFDDRLPTASWTQTIYPYIKYERAFYSPEAKDRPAPTYALNARLKGRNFTWIAGSDRAVMLFETLPGENLWGGRELLPEPPRHGSETGLHNIGFADGHAKGIPDREIDALIWRPTFEKPRKL